jgi:ABC-type transport system substrate-binding protein
VPTLSCAGFRPNTPENTNEPEFCDPRIDRLMRKALALESTDPVRANFLWGTVDRKLTDAAPWAPLFNAVWTDFAANRVDNYEFNPQGRVLLDQLWVR